MTKFDNYYVEDPLFDDFIDIKFMIYLRIKNF